MRKYDAVNSQPMNLSWAIFIISVLGLYLELMLIRWIGTEIRIFAYLQNTVLVACFMGLGLGLFTSKKPITLRHILIPLAVLILLMTIPTTNSYLRKISSLLSVFQDLLIWFKHPGGGLKQNIISVSLGLGMTFIIMFLVMAVFVPVGRLLGWLMNEHPNTIAAYSINIAGSLVGTLLFAALGILHQVPVVWMVAFTMLLILFVNRSNNGWKMDVALISFIIGLSFLAGIQPGTKETVWSPYQKLALIDGEKMGLPAYKYLLHVNNVSYQTLIDLGEENVGAHPKLYPPDMKGLGQYDIPALLHPDPKKILVVGAGAGNDAAGLLRQGARKITAVEIDPAIVKFGRFYHPENPYRSQRVNVVIDDARSFFAGAKEKFDLIICSLLDSHTTTAMTNARLDHYVYTLESFTRMRDLLNEGGVLVMSFAAQKHFIAKRIARMLRDVFGNEPLCFLIPPSAYGFGGVMFVSGDVSVALKQIDMNPRLRRQIADWIHKFPINITYTTNITTDDWPYLYLEHRKIPILFYLLAVLMVILFFTSAWIFKAEGMVWRWNRGHWHFFFLGAAFLLLEVQNISKSAVALGNTWLVNVVIISGVLLMILLANLLTFKFPKLPLGPVYALLFATCIALYFVDMASFAHFPIFTKSVMIGLLTTLPMLFGGMIFIRSFNTFAAKDEGLGANLFGALVGALMQSATFIVGFKALLLITTGLYLMAFFTRLHLPSQ